jgi:hypothetical protein
MHEAMSGLACQLLGLPSLAPASVSLKHLLSTEAGAAASVLFITSTGADPCQELLDYAAGGRGVWA